MSIESIESAISRNPVPVVSTGTETMPSPQRDSTPRVAKSVAVAYLWWFFLGLFGVHHFYLGRAGRGLLHLCTLGVCGLGWLADGFTLPRQVRSANSYAASSNSAAQAGTQEIPILNDSFR